MPQQKLGQRRILLTLLLGVALNLGASMSAHAVIYQLDNKYWGALNPPNYGLRVNGLAGGSWTYDFAHAQSNVEMKVVDNGASDYDLHIYGMVYGGKQSGNTYATGTTGLWDLDFWYTDGVQVGMNGILVDADMAMNSGTGVGTGMIAYTESGNLGGHLPSNTNPVINLAAFSGKYSFSFCYGDVSEFGINNSHCGMQIHPITGETVYKGAGWLLNSSEFDGPATYVHGDFGFTGSVPEPSTIALLGFGIAGLGLVGRRRRR